MAIYTQLKEKQLLNFLAPYQLGSLESFMGVSEGTENTTYFLTVNGREYVLTLFENRGPKELLFFVGYLTYLESSGLPVPGPLVTSSNEALQFISGKPVLLFNRAPGKYYEMAAPRHCESIGAVLGSIHRAGESFKEKHHYPWGLGWMRETAMLLENELDEADINLARQQIALMEELQAKPLPKGIIHGDLFRDNVLWVNDRITAVIDFYEAGFDILLLDLAIVINDWCCLDDGTLDRDKASAIITGYRSQREFSESEKQNWQSISQAAASRFWLSRLKAGSKAHQDVRDVGLDPNQYKQKMLKRRDGDFVPL
jgi:homoserine kinase type II